MENFAHLFILSQELESRFNGTARGLNIGDPWTEIDALLALHGEPVMVNDEWTIPVWGGVAADRGLVDRSQFYLD
jgi:hypothetical protein